MQANTATLKPKCGKMAAGGRALKRPITKIKSITVQTITK
jgi:hypothetical protein